MGIERDGTRDFNSSSAGRLGGRSKDGADLTVLPGPCPYILSSSFCLIALLTHLYAKHYRDSLPYETTVLPTEVYHTRV